MSHFINRTNAKSVFNLFTVLLAVLGVSPIIVNSAHAAEDDGGWEVVLTPYLWGVALDGETAVGPLPPVDVDASFGDILDALNFAASLHTEFRKGKWNFVIDPTYLDLELDTPTQDVLLPPIPPGTPATVGGKIKVKQWLVEAWTSYLVAPGWEVLGGVRWQSQDIDVRLNNVSLSPSSNEDWADFFAGARWSKALTEKWSMSLRGDYALAGDSESGSWNGVATFNRRFGKAMALNLGYRYFKNEYQTGSGQSNYLWDITMSGPYVGYTWQFGNVSWPR